MKGNLPEKLSFQVKLCTVSRKYQTVLMLFVQYYNRNADPFTVAKHLNVITIEFIFFLHVAVNF